MTDALPPDVTGARVVAGGALPDERPRMSGKLPLLATDLTWARFRAGRAYSGLVDWDLDRAPVPGEQVIGSDGGAEPTAATIMAVEVDGTIVLDVAAYRRAPE